MAKNTVNLDFSGLGILPEDQPYLCMVSKLEMGVSQQQKPMVSGEFTIEEPDVKGVKGRKIFRTFSLQDQALFALHGLLKAMGESSDDLGNGSFAFNPDNYVGKLVTVYVQTRESDEFGDKSEPRRFAPESAYAEAGAI